MSIFLSAEHEDAVKVFVAERLRNITNGFGPKARAIGWLKDNGDGTADIIGGIVLWKHNPWDGEVSIALEPGCVVTREHLKALFHVGFKEFGLARLTCHIARKNTKARRFAEIAGFRHEGALRRGYDGKQTAILYGMVSEECRWI